MEFNEEKTKEIAIKLGRSEKTIRVWKSRNCIPDKYFKEDFKPTVPASDKSDKVLLDRIKGIKTNEYLNFEVICGTAGVKYEVLADALRGKGIIDKDDLMKVVNEIKKVKTNILNRCSTGDIYTLFNIPSLKYYVINGHNNWSKSMYNALKKRNDINRFDKDRLINNYKTAYLKIVI